MIRKILLISIVFCGILWSPAVAQIYHEDAENFKKYNPDGQKYDYVKDYLLALDHIHRNQKGYAALDGQTGADIDGAGQMKGYIDYLKKANIQFRIAKNLLNKYSKTGNGLILESRKLFIEGCEGVIAANNKERELLSAYYETLINEGAGEFDTEELAVQQGLFAHERKEANRTILESADIVKNVLISNQPNRYGEFTRLGITELERNRLIQRMNALFGDGLNGGIQEGQTFLEASVSTIRGILEDNTWLSMDI